MKRDPYLILNVSPLATEQQIVKSFRRLARIYHPDINERSDADRRMQDINWGYELLKDPAKKAAYDLAHPVASPKRAARRPSRPYEQERKPKLSTRTWRRQASPTPTYGFLRGGTDRAAVGVSVSLLVNAIFIMASQAGVCLGPLIALTLGCWLAAVKGKKTSERNGMWVGVGVGTETVLLSQMLYPGWVGGADIQHLLLLIIPLGVLIGLAMGGILGSYFGKHKSPRRISR